MKTSICASMIGFSFLSWPAFASVVCAPAMVAGNHESPACASFEIPDHSAMSFNFSCNGYKFSVNCDLHSRPNTLSLSIVGPNGTTVSTSSENELKLLDDNGNGTLIRCTAD